MTGSIRLLRAGVLTALSDGLFSSLLTVFVYHSTLSRLWQGVAAVLLGRDAIGGGARTVVIGLLMHCGVALGWSAVFFLVVQRLSVVQRILRSPYGTLKVAALYGPFVWMMMSLVVIPLLVGRPPAITVRWWIQLFGHAPFVGLPIVATIAGRPARAPEGTTP